MAKQAGDFFIEGTIDELTYYKMYGTYYVRRKSSLTKKKFHKSRAFERSRESCRRFSEGNRLASRLYRRMEKEKRVYSVFCFLKKRAILLLKEGKSLQETEQILREYLMEFGFVKNTDERSDCIKCPGKDKRHTVLEGGVGETACKKILKAADLPVTVRLTTGILYVHRVKGNMLFLGQPDSKGPWIKEALVYDYIDIDPTFKKNLLKFDDLKEFIEDHNASGCHQQKERGSEITPYGRWRESSYEKIAARDKTSLSIRRLKDQSIADWVSCLIGIKCREDCEEPGICVGWCRCAENHHRALPFSGGSPSIIINSQMEFIYRNFSYYSFIPFHRHSLKIK